LPLSRCSRRRWEIHGKGFKANGHFFPVLGWLERLIYKLAGIDPAHEMDWKALFARPALLQYRRIYHCLLPPIASGEASI